MYICTVMNFLIFTNLSDYATCHSAGVGVEEGATKRTHPTRAVR